MDSKDITKVPEDTSPGSILINTAATTSSSAPKRTHDEVDTEKSVTPMKKHKDEGTPVLPKSNSTDTSIPSGVHACTSSSSTTSSSSPTPVLPKSDDTDNSIPSGVNECTSSSSTTPPPSSSTKQAEGAIFDMAQTSNLLPGARVEVRWDIHHEDLVNSVTVPRTHTRWWGATLLAHDGRHRDLQEEPDENGNVSDKVKVPVRELNYDPFPSGGFDECSRERVCFLTDHAVLNMDSNEQAFWRKEGDSWDPIINEIQESNLFAKPLPAADLDDDDISVESSSREEALRKILDTVLKTALLKSGVMGKMRELPPSQQRIVAEKIASAKEKLTQKLMEQLRSDDDINLANVITPTHVRRCMEELGKELKM